MYKIRKLDEQAIENAEKKWNSIAKPLHSLGVFEEIIKNSETPVFVYESDNKVVGYVFCIVTNYHNDTSFCDHKTIYIDDLCVDENARHEGIGTALYEYVLEYAKSIGCHNVTLNVWEGNDSAIKFYENIGMKIQKVSMEQIL